MTRRMVLALFVLGLAAPAVAKAPPTLVIRGKLTGTSSAPLCGVVHWATVMRYEVLEVLDGTYTPKLLYAVFDCGSIDGKPHGVKIGEVHRLTVKPLPADLGASIVDAFANDKSVPRFLAVHAD